MGIGAVVGAVVVMMLPQQCSARKLIDKAAEKVENAANQLTSNVNAKLDKM